MPSKIEWTDEAWNPMHGCTPISSGCKNCYAKRMATRLRGRCGYPAEDPFRVTLRPERLEQPFHWRKPKRIFVCSMGDLFHDDVSFEFVDEIFAVMALNPEHRFMILTKRPLRMGEYLNSEDRECAMQEASCLIGDKFFREYNLGNMLESMGGYWFSGQYGDHGRCEFQPGWEGMEIPWPLPNVWIGVSVENQETADERIPLLLKCPAAKRFVSAEPLLGPVSHLSGVTQCGYCGGTDYSIERGSIQRWCDDCGQAYIPLEWIICGGETGPGARPMLLGWARSLRDQCVEADVPFFFKRDSNGNRELDGETWEQMPK